MQTIDDVWNKFATQDDLAEAYLNQLKENPMQQQIIKHYGYENQAQKLIEELQELQHAIIYEGEENVKEEMADVLNLIEQISHYKNWEADIYKVKYFKIQRQLERIKNEVTNE